MGIGFHFDDIEQYSIDIQNWLYDGTPIGGFHVDDFDQPLDDDAPIGGLHGEFRETDCDDLR